MIDQPVAFFEARVTKTSRFHLCSSLFWSTKESNEADPIISVSKAFFESRTTENVERESSIAISDQIERSKSRET
jgi:hypothetical protein